MSPADLTTLLEAVQAGRTSPADALERLAQLPFRDVGVATVDHHRPLRQGTAEVIFGEGKTADEIATIAEELKRHGQNVLVTRMSAEKAYLVVQRVEGLRYDPTSRLGVYQAKAPESRQVGPIGVVTAGTSDRPVAEEAAQTLAFLGFEVRTMGDLGVAGLHRLLARLDDVVACSALVVVAGMEGALPSVVGGLYRGPVIAVPTSVGYGAALGGLAALMGMLTSCAAGVTVVNIDNGFGAAMAVHRMFSKSEPHRNAT